MAKSLISKRTLLGLLGFAAATSCDEVVSPPCMYGTPSMDYEVSGKVVDQDSKAIEGISVKVERDFSEQSVLTSKDGSFVVKGKSFPGSLELSFEDIDGEANGGEFVTKTQEVELEQVAKGSDSWNKGKFAARDVKVILEKKQ